MDSGWKVVEKRLSTNLEMGKGYAELILSHGSLIRVKCLDNTARDMQVFHILDYVQELLKKNSMYGYFHIATSVQLGLM